MAFLFLLKKMKTLSNSFLFSNIIFDNGLNMVRLAFQRSKFSGLHYVYLLLSSLVLALSAKCTIFFVVVRFSTI